MYLFLSQIYRTGNAFLVSAVLAYLLKYGATHGTFEGVITVEHNTLVVNGQKTVVLSEKDPAKLPWAELGIDYVADHWTV